MSGEEKVINYRRETESSYWTGGHRRGYYRNRGRSYQHRNRKEEERKRFWTMENKERRNDKERYGDHTNSGVKTMCVMDSCERLDTCRKDGVRKLDVKIDKKECGEIRDSGKVNEVCRDADNKITDQTKPEMDKFLEGMRINRMYMKMFYDMMEGHSQLNEESEKKRSQMYTKMFYDMMEKHSEIMEEEYKKQKGMMWV